MKQDGTLFTLENDELLVTVARRGAELTRIYDKKADREVLWCAEPSVWNRHAPVLFPFVGKCYEGAYVHDGKEYGMTPHGFARDMDFEPLLCDMDECWFRLKDTPETYEKYPFHFEVEIGHRLEGRTIEVMWKVANTDSGEMLFMMGGHPAFQVPEGKNIYDFTFEFNRRGCREGQFTDCLHYLAPNANGYEKEELQGNLKLSEGRVPLTKGFFDTALTYMFDEAQVSSASLMVDGSPYVTLECSDFPYLGIWTMEATHPFVCLEPWYGICASDGYKGELKDRRGIISLPGWENWQKSYQIRVE
ncbi:aldose 1-epimerase family protein [Enterocloster bolteae]|uniref:aldose 1-epimerase family protein n=1 Tax=Enterocloster bolteae TaxID=208479 RepID=UPI001D0705E5|nr:aldose 1-epimerase family protein [Enterocloster bolteae]MCB6928904.1 aldose 1-epimerase family protein [Enterocloster bolteae]MCQ4758123.1 aldose 1-epimerase family protein [Enterocloster bolteae]